MTTTTAAGSFVMGFGKHRGETLAAIPRGYLHWILENVGNLHAETRAAIETYLGEPATLPGTDAPRPEKKKRATRRSSEGAPKPTCGICGQPGTTARPLVHAACATEDVPF